MRRIILHGHIFKNAGTTFDWSLARSFAGGFVEDRQDDEMRARGREHIAALVESRESLVALSSHHMPRDLPRLKGVRFEPVYLLRHPLERMRSAYDFERKQRIDTPGSLAAKSKSFRDYVEWRMQNNVSRTIRNYQTLYLAGHHRRASNAKIAVKFFSAAIETLRKVQLVGLVELYDESMVLFETALRESFPEIDLSYVSQNVSRKKRRQEEPGSAVAATLQALGNLQQQVIDENSYDLALYQLVKSRLTSQMAAIDDFDDRLAEFRRRCERLQQRRLVEDLRRHTSRLRRRSLG
jgi:hypothetical protein